MFRSSQTKTMALITVLTALLSGYSGEAFHQPLFFSTKSRPVSSIISSNPLSSHKTMEDLDDKFTMERREFWTQSLATAAITAATTTIPFSFPDVSNAADLQLYQDADYGFKLSVPSTWETTEQKLSGRRKAVFIVDPSSGKGNNLDTLLIIAYTPIRDDFTSLASFGSVDQVAQSTILPRGALTPGMEGNESKMLEAVSKNRGGFNAYYFDYVTTPEVPSQDGLTMKTLEKLHFRTIFTMLPLKNGAGSTLVTITMQTTEEKYGGLKGVFDEIVGSFGKN